MLTANQKRGMKYSKQFKLLHKMDIHLPFKGSSNVIRSRNSIINIGLVAPDGNHKSEYNHVIPVCFNFSK